MAEKELKVFPKSATRWEVDLVEARFVNLKMVSAGAGSTREKYCAFLNLFKLDIKRLIRKL